MQQLPLDMRLIEEPSLENFVSGANQELMARLSDIRHGSRPSKCLLIWGTAGTGKTHLLQALEGATAGSQLRICDQCDQLDAAGQQALFEAFISQVNDPNAMIIASASQAPLHLKLREDLRSRLGSGLVVQLKALNDDEKAQALRQHAAARQINLPEELLRYLLRHYPRDIRSLMKMLDKLDRFAFEHKRALSLPLLKSMQQDEETGGSST